MSAISAFSFFPKFLPETFFVLWATVAARLRQSLCVSNPGADATASPDAAGSPDLAFPVRPAAVSVPGGGLGREFRAAEAGAHVDRSSPALTGSADDRAVAPQRP